VPAGGMAAKILAEGGLNCVLLEAGPNVNPEKRFQDVDLAVRLPHRGAGVGGRARENFSEFLAPNGAWEIDGEPYTSAPGANSSGSVRASSVAAPIIGAASRCGLLLSTSSPARATGLGDDWPITYEDLAPYYDKVESYIGVFGTKENVSSAPDGIFLLRPSRAATN